MHHHDYLLLILFTKLALCLVPLVAFVVWDMWRKSARNGNRAPIRPAKRFSFIQLSGR